MTNMREKHIEAMSESGGSRRRFLKSSVAAAVGVSSIGTAQSHAAGCQTASGENVGKQLDDGDAPLREVQGKVAFITGGSSGIGLGIARAFADAGMKVVIGYRTKEHRDNAMEYLRDSAERVHAINVDVTDRPGMERAGQEVISVFGKVHMLVNNAGVIPIGPISTASYDDWDWVMGVNVGGVFNGIHAFLPLIRRHGEGGHIVTTSSILGLIVTSGVYDASKSAVIGMMEALRGELIGSNIGVSAYCPGWVNTDLWNAARNRPNSFKDAGSAIGLNSVNPAEEAATRAKLGHAGMDPFEAGRLVLQGVRSNDLYILTHPEFNQGIVDRNEALVAASPIEANVPPARVEGEREALRNPIYLAERDRRLCREKKTKRNS